MNENMGQEATFQNISPQRISDTAYEILREKIVSQELAPGQRLDLNSMEAQMGISRTPLKEALARLEMEGLVEIRARSGTYVTNPNPADIAESFDVRLALEMHAVETVALNIHDDELSKLCSIVQQLGRLAAAPDRDAIYPRYLALDHQFHGILVGLSGNSRLSQLHQRENLHAQMARIRYRRSERELDQAQQEHEALLHALEAHDPEAARQVMRAHLSRAKSSLLMEMDGEAAD
jgi:DNA-binding GntR family transcriptional regulator